LIVEKIVIENFKCFRNFTLDFNSPLTIIVGDNETGKSTLLEAINLCLTEQLDGKPAIYEISPYLFNKDMVSEYLAKLRNGEPVAPPIIKIELYLKDSPQFARLKGTNNSRHENAPGLTVSIELDEDCKPDYEEYINKPDEIEGVPVEYYKLKWYSFAFDPLTRRRLKLHVTFIDTTIIRLQYGTDFYINKLIDENLSNKEKVGLSVEYRRLKEKFKSNEAIQKINTNLIELKGGISDRDLSISIDVTQRTGWQNTLTSYLDDVPFQFVGKGDQSILKVLLALEKKIEESQIILIEEPENHLSYSRMSYLIDKIRNKCMDKQVIITTHSTFVMNKLGINSVILFGCEQTSSTLADLSPDTHDYFLKLPGYNTLRLIVAKKAILVEGPSDELIVQKAYLQIHNKMPLDDQVDIISVGALSFKRFLDIACLLNTEVIIMTDNDGDHVKKVSEKYKDYVGKGNIHICFSTNDDLRTLEYHIADVNDLKVLGRIFRKEFNNKVSLRDHMLKNKTECALKLFLTNEKLIIPEYIQKAIL
jgi:putative ATP-dependent endonuclease of the OLD family